MIRSIALVLSLALPFAASAQDDASLLAPLAPHPTKSHRHRHKAHNDLDQLAPLDLPTTLLLRDRVLGAMTALVDLRREVADARIDLLLATEDRALVPEGAR